LPHGWGESGISACTKITNLDHQNKHVFHAPNWSALIEERTFAIVSRLEKNKNQSIMGLIQSSENVRSRNLRGAEEDSSEVADTQLADVLILLANFNSSKVPIPLQLVVEILNYAGTLSPLVARREVQFTSGSDCNTTYLEVTLPNAKYVQPTGIQLTVNSKDQGWSSYPNQRGTRTSNTWGEICLSSDPNDRITVFRNIHAGREFEEQEVDVSALDWVPPGQYQSFLDKIAAVRDGKLHYDCFNAHFFHSTHPLLTSPTTHAYVVTEPLSLALVVRSQYPGWTISMEHAELSVSYQLAGDWEAFAAHCAQIRGR